MQFSSERSEASAGMYPIPVLLPVDTRRAAVVSLVMLRHASSVKHLKRNKCARGKFFLATVRSPIVRMDKHAFIPVTVGGREMLLGIYHSLPVEVWSDRDYLVGARVAIKEPFYLSAGTYSSGLTLSKDCLAVGCSTSVKFLGIQDSGSVVELRMKGNKAFNRGEFFKASLYYTECIGRSQYQEQEMLLAVSNRAEAYLRLDKVDQAYADAETALHLNPSHVKSMLRKAKALLGIQEHQEALTVLEQALVYTVSEEEAASLKEVRDRCEVFLKQSRDGVYDISDFLLGNFKPELAPACSDYVGPVELFMTPDGRGRGLLVTRDVELGELLLVSNPISLLSEATCPPAKLYVEAIEKCAISSRFYSQMEALGNLEVVPDMTAFIPNSGIPPSVFQRVIDPVKISTTAERSRISHRINPEKVAWTGVWGLPGFLNHSCIPNVSLLKVGAAMFVHAACNIKQGEELLISYTDPVAAWFGFRKDRLLASFGFACNCKRCKLETSLHQQLLEDGNKIAKTYMDRVVKNIATAGDCMVFWQQLNVTMLSLGLDDDTMWMITGGFVDVFNGLGSHSTAKLASWALAVGRGRWTTVERLLGYIYNDFTVQVKDAGHISLTLDLREALIGCVGRMEEELLKNVLLSYLSHLEEEVLTCFQS